MSDNQGNSSHTEPSGQLNFYKLKLPLSDLPFEERINAVSENGIKANAMFEKNMQDLDSLIKMSHPIYLLARMGLQLVSADGSSLEYESEDPLLQYHVELLQALALRYKICEFGHAAPDDEGIEGLIKKLSTNFFVKRTAECKADSSNLERRDRAIRESVRIQTQAVRNWGYPHHMRELLNELLTPLDSKAVEKIGLSFSALINGLHELTRVLEFRLGMFEEYRDKILSATSCEEAINAYSSGFESDPELEKVREFASDKTIPLDLLVTTLMSRTELFLPSLCVYELEELVELFTGSSTDPFGKVIVESLSLKFGDLSSANPEHLFMANPIWTKPFIDLEDGSLMIVFPGILVSFALEIIESLMDEGLLAAYQRRRAKYLEEKIQNLIQNYLPAAQVFRGSLWIDPNEPSKTFENDVLAVMDSFAFVFEAKSAKVPSSVRRGGRGLKRSIEDLIVDPSDQGLRFADFLKSNLGYHEFETLRGAVNKVDVSKVKYFIPVNITFDDVSAFCDQAELQEAGLVGKRSAIAPTILLADLMVILEVLQEPASIVHYFKRRSHIDTEVTLEGDELDILFLYLETGFNLPEELLGSKLILLGNSHHFDSYFLGQIHGVDKAKPSIRMTDLWRRIIERLQLTGNPRWTEIACVMQNICLEDQQRIESQLASVRRTFDDPKFDENSQSILFTNGLHGGSEGLVVHVYRNLSREQRNKDLLDMAGYHLYESKTQICIAFSSKFDRLEFPYDVLMLTEP